MRRFASLVLVLCLVFSLSACGESVAEDGLKGGANIHTIAFISDTQRYAESKSEVNIAMIKSLVDDKDKYGIEYVIHAGDLVQKAEKEEEWLVARDALSRLDGIIPYGVLAGNHDQDTGENRFTAYGTYFGEESYKNFDYFGESYENCRAHYQLVTVGSTDFIVVYISDDPDKGSIEFANEAFKKYPERVGILCTHKYLEEDLTLEEMGEYMQKEIVEKNDNVYLVLCGHESAAGYLETNVGDRTVIQIMANYQDAQNDGTLMYLQIDEADKTISGISYSPVTNSYEGYSDLDTDRFIVKIPWELK